MRTEPHASDRTIGSVHPAGSHVLFLRPHIVLLALIRVVGFVALSHTRPRSLTSAAISRARGCVHAHHRQRLQCQPRQQAGREFRAGACDCAQGSWNAGCIHRLKSHRKHCGASQGPDVPARQFQWIVAGAAVVAVEVKSLAVKTQRQHQRLPNWSARSSRTPTMHRRRSSRSIPSSAKCRQLPQ